MHRGLAVLAAVLCAGPVAARQLPVRPPDVTAAQCAKGASVALIERLLRVEVNGSQTGRDFIFLQRPCGALLARRSDLAALRVRAGGQAVVEIDGEQYLNLNDYDGLRYAIDLDTQRLELTGEPQVFEPTVLDLQPAAPPPATASAVGAFVNYGVFASGMESQRDYSASAGLGVFGGEWVGLSDWLYLRMGETSLVHRLDTTLVRDLPERVATLRFGDVFARGGSAGGGASLGGVQYATNFATRPGLSIGPVQMLEAATAQGASVGLYVNPQDPQRDSRAVFLSGLTTVPHGPVELINVPTYNNGEYELLLRDSLGREVLVRQEYFFNAGLLRAGLHDFSYEAGLQRAALAGDEYGAPALSGSHRYGFTNALTGEAQVLLTDAGTLAGIGALWSVPHVGVVALTAAGTESELVNEPGFLGAASIENRYERHAWALRAECQDASFLEPTARVAPVASTICRGVLGLSGAVGGDASLSLSAGVAHLRADDDRRNLRLGYTLRPWSGANLTLYAGWAEGDSTDVSAGMLFSTSLAPLSRAGLGRVGGLDSRRTQLSVSANGGDDGVDRAQGRLSTGARAGETALGVQVASSLAGTPQQSVTLSAAAPRLIGVGGVQSQDGAETWSLGATGAVAFVEGRALPTKPLYSSFALVRLGPENGGVRVNGIRADEQGDVLVAPLQAYAENPVAVNAADLPMNARFAETGPVAPRWRSGVVVRPRIERVRDAMITVHVRSADGTTRPIPPGAWARRAGGERFPAGDDGAIYLSGLDAVTPIEIVYRDLRCELELRLPEVQPSDAIPEIGPLLCEGASP